MDIEALFVSMWLSEEEGEGGEEKINSPKWY